MRVMIGDSETVLMPGGHLTVRVSLPQIRSDIEICSVHLRLAPVKKPTFVRRLLALKTKYFGPDSERVKN
jgi:hypothetical protein